MKEYGVIIVGAGPGGLAAAKVLAENQKKVLVLEKNPIIGPKTCAGGLTVKDFELGIPETIAERFFDNCILETPLAKDNIKNDKPFVATVNRKELGQFMQKEAEKAGAEIITSCEVTDISQNEVETSDKEKIGFKHLIGADGGHSLVRRHLKLPINEDLVAFHYKVPTNMPEMVLIFDAALFGSGYAWIFPHVGWTSIGACADPIKLIKADQLQSNFKKWAVGEKIDISNSTYEAWMINYDYQGYEFGNIFLIGDAAGFASGLTGEGMYYAMVSGQEVARKIIDQKYACPKIAEILSHKEKHEKVLSMMNFNKTLTQAEYDTFGLLAKTHLLDRKLIDSFA